MLRLFEASGAIHYDLVELDKAKICDLDMGQVAEYFTRYHISFLEESEEERQRLMLHADILGQNSKPTVAGLLIFILSPERIFPASGISFAHFSGRDIVEKLIDKKNIFGKLVVMSYGQLNRFLNETVVFICVLFLRLNYINREQQY